MKINRNLLIMCFASFFQSLTFAMPVIALFKQSRGLSMSDIFILESIFMVLMIMLEVPWGYIADKIGYRKTLIVSYFIFMLSRIVLYNAHSFEMFLLEALTAAIAISGLSGCDTAIIYSSIDENESEKAFSRYSFSSTLGFFTASLVSTIIISKSMDLAIYLTIFTYAIAFIASLFLKEVDIKAHERVNITGSFKNVFKNKRIILFVISISLIGEAWKSVVVVLNQSQYLRSGIPIRYFGIITALMCFITMISGKAYKFSERFGQRKVLLVMQLVLTGSIFVLMFTKSPVLSIMFVAVIEFSYAICGPLFSDIENKSIITADRATILSIYAMINDITGAGFNIVIGKACDISLQKGFLSCGIMGILSVILLLIYYRQNKNHITNENMVVNVNKSSL